jgi:putative ABC transport system permease protein
MRALTRKLVRDVWRTRAQVASIGLVLAGGVLCVMAIRGAASSLTRARDAYYRNTRFADVFATITRAPDELATRLAAVPGVARVATRVVKDVRLDVPGLDRPATGRLISLPGADTDAERINRVSVLRGRAVAPDAEDEVLVSGRFMESNHLDLGDTLVAVINERRARLRIVGVGAAPDYLYEEAGGGMAVDERSFGILWAPAELMTDATGMRGAFNDVAIELRAGAHERAVIGAVDSLLSRYGGRGAIGRHDQLSHRVVQNELQQLDVMGMAFPAFFVGVAAFLAGMVLTRLVTTEREQIAVLKAFGYSSGEVARHYLAYAAIAVALGLVVGVVLGTWLGRRFTALYADILRIPGLHFQLDWMAMITAMVVLSLATLSGAARAVLNAARLAPAAGMQPPVPPRYGPLLLDRLGFGGALPAAARMVLRGLERHPARALLGAVGVAAALGLMSGSLSLYDASRRMIEVQFQIGHRETLAVQLSSAVPAVVRASFGALPGVTHVELARVIPVRLHHAGRSRTLGLSGMESNATLNRLVDVTGRTHELPPDGVAISASLARSLDVRVGDTLQAELLEQGMTRPLVIVAQLDELMSPNAYMELGALGRLTGDGPLANGVYLQLAGPATDALSTRLRDMPRVIGVSSRGAMLEQFDRMMGRSFRVTAVLVVVFAGVIAIGVVYNGARIALSERGRELASLRVLGFTTREVGAMLLGEQAILTLLAIPLGWLLGWMLAGYLAGAFESEQYQVPLVVRAQTYVFGTIVVLVASVLAAAMMYRRTARLDLVAVLKTRD